MVTCTLETLSYSTLLDDVSYNGARYQSFGALLIFSMILETDNLRNQGTNTHLDRKGVSLGRLVDDRRGR